MDKLIAALEEKGVNVNDGMSTDQIMQIAKAVGVEPLEHMDRVVEIVDYTNKRKQTNKFIKTLDYSLGTNPETGKTIVTKGLFLRLEVLDQAIADLAAAKELVEKTK